MILALNDAPQAIHVNAMFVTVIIGTIVPILVGLVSKGSWKWKGLAMVVINGVQAGIVKATISDGGAAWTAQTLLFAVLAIVASVAAYQHIWTPLNLVSTTDAAGTPKGILAPTKGLG